LLRDGAWAGGPGSKDFRLDLTAGTYQVTVTMGDATYARDLMAVNVVPGLGSGAGVSGITTGAGQFAVRALAATTHAQGQLVLRFSDAGGDPYWVLNALEIRPVQAPLTLTGPGGTLEADGLSVDTFSMTAPAGTLVTLTTDRGSLVGVTDASSVYA